MRYAVQVLGQGLPPGVHDALDQTHSALLREVLDGSVQKRADGSESPATEPDKPK